jgi:hypothetical protein
MAWHGMAWHGMQRAPFPWAVRRCGRSVHPRAGPHLPHARVAPEDAAQVADGSQAVRDGEVLEELVADAARVQAQAHVAAAGNGGTARAARQSPIFLCGHRDHRAARLIRSFTSNCSQLQPGQPAGQRSLGRVAQCCGVAWSPTATHPTPHTYLRCLLFMHHTTQHRTAPQFAHPPSPPHLLMRWLNRTTGRSSAPAVSSCCDTCRTWRDGERERRRQQREGGPAR